MPRRKGDRGIYPLGPNLWRIRVSAGADPARSTPERTRYRTIERRYEGTLTGAREERARLMVEARQGRFGGTEATVDGLLDAWLLELDRIGRAPSTIAGYRAEMDRYVRPTMGRLKVKQVTPRMLTELLEGLSVGGLSPATVQRVRAGLSSAFSQAMRWEWVERDPTKLVRGPSLPNRRPAIPTVDEVVLLLGDAEASKEPAMARAIWLAATTGVRRGELCALKVSHFDLERGRMMVEQAISADKVWTTKNRKWREVALDPLTVEVVWAQVRQLEQRATEAGTRLRPDAYLFTDRPDGRDHWRPDRVTKSFRRLTLVCHRPECNHLWPDSCLTLRHITFHQLRKFMESAALDAGFSVAEVAHRAGHDPSMLMRVYAGSVDDTAKKMAGVVASLLAPGQ